MPDRDPLTGKTKHTELSLDQIASLQPGLGRLMPEVSYRYHIAYYAARGGNWALARYQLSELGGLLQLGSLTRPKYETQLSAFQRIHLTALLAAVDQHDFPAFEQAFARATEVANIYHQATGHPEIVWRLPPGPPDHLDLSPHPDPGPPAD